MTTKKPRPIVRLGRAVHVARYIKTIYGHEAQWIEERRDVRVMAVAEGYAMVRRKGAMPYVCSVEEIHKTIEESTP